MPTVILLDVSLSMSRPVMIPECNEDYHRRHLAIHAINTLLDHCSANNKFEFISLIGFSSLCKELCTFTRDYEEIKKSLDQIGDYDKTCIETALAGVSSIVTNEWGKSSPTQVVLITDGCCGVGSKSLAHTLQTGTTRGPTDDRFPLPFPFSSKLHIMLVAPSGDQAMLSNMPHFQKLIDLNGGRGDIYVPEGSLSMVGMEKMCKLMAGKHFVPYTGTLKCGHLSCHIQVYPAPQTYEKDHDFEHMKREVSKTLEICGFLDIADIASPAAISRHLVLSSPEKDNKNKVKNDEEEKEEEVEEGKVASFTVLLHGSLKVEGMVALTQLAEDWFGILYSWADSKKKSNLHLSAFEPGWDAVPWLGRLCNLASNVDFPESVYEENRSPFPVRPPERRSYAQNCVVWVKLSGIQADVQKILRHARKLPEKQQHFYKELNRIRKAALAFGFLELLESLSAILERECQMLPGTAHPDAALQLTHAANALRSDTLTDISQLITPLRTNFTAD